MSESDSGTEMQRENIYMLMWLWVLTKQKETWLKFVSVCVWHVIWRWQMAHITASAVTNRLPRRHCSHGLFWWGGEPKGDRVTTHSLASHASDKSPPSSPPFFLYPDCLSHTWSIINTPPALLTNTLLHFHWDKHTYSILLLVPALSQILPLSFLVTHTTESV